VPGAELGPMQVQRDLQLLQQEQGTLAQVERMSAQEQRLLERGPQPELELVAPGFEQRSRR
jgi:hypothetical protein